MPKMKTHKGMAKRVKRTATGKFLRGHAYTSHMFSHKSQKQKRKLRQYTVCSPGDTRRIARLLPG